MYSVIQSKHFSVEEGFPTIKGDGRHHSFVSQYNDTFQGTWSTAAQSVEKVTQQQLFVMSRYSNQTLRGLNKNLQTLRGKLIYAAVF